MPKHKDANQEENSGLRNCKLCGKGISPYSPFCRNCGHPQGSPLALWLLGLFLVLLIAVYMAMTVFCMCNVQRYRVYTEPNPMVEQTTENQPPGQEGGEPAK